ncbi:DEAD/DEAH box helicase [Alteribacter natronophilus]|uniref:DEAD/DEAH box helicase n=1 Tax=Alteribacter natronophilus TaxID=2583810 RepID=UPI00110DF16B|nr:DEAD/DEAH box helicase [Alteribacter natronophilus]TMW72766.1 DUF3427 domain-containing protein [Alteribacter natronophilus]
MDNYGLIVNSGSKNLWQELTSSLESCKRFYISVAFINYSGLQLLLDSLNEATNRGVSGRVITSTYLNFTEPKAVEKLTTFPGVDVRVFLTDQQNTGFHTKAYIFEYDDSYKVIIGSSNVTQSALKSNVEWNVRIISKQEDVFMKQVLREYESLWERSNVADDQFLNDYKEMHEKLEHVVIREKKIHEEPAYFTPNSMQRRAMENLERLRSLGESKALVIAATGTGKTFMSAFDVRKYKPKKLLFIVHREEILQKAKETFEVLLENFPVTFGVLTGTQKDLGADYLFANIRTLSNYYTDFHPSEFDYIIYDEAHHTAAQSYEEVLDYFNPKFTLGMTATPERGDGVSIFEIFDHNVALEVRLHDALEDDIVVPFHYFGITDIDGIDLSDVAPEDIDEITSRLNVKERVDFIRDKMLFYGHDGPVRKGLGFCASREHAEFMANEFNKLGINSDFLTGNTDTNVRQQRIDDLEDDHHPLQFLFTVDIFNEGVDIPSVNLVLMLRPTNSPIIFIQQLGRGLRKHKNKQFLTVLDFIGNYAKSFLIAIALNGQRYYDKETLKVAVATGFAHIPGATHIQMDRIAQEQILEQLEQERFTSMKYLKEQYEEFKRVRNGEVPYFLMDYHKYDGAPDPVGFVKKKGTYPAFVANAEKDKELQAFVSGEFEKALKWLSSMLPIKRPHDFAILLKLLSKESVSLDESRNEMGKWVEGVDEDTALHSMEFLSQAFFDSREKSTIPKLVEHDGNLVRRSEFLTSLIEDNHKLAYIEDTIEYGLHRYEWEFGSRNFGQPFFKLYEQYQMRDAALLSNFRKSHSSFRGSGLIPSGNNYFLYIDLHKEADVEERLNYNDKIIDRDIFQWESPHTTRQDTDTGKNLIHHRKRGTRVHLFVRKYRSLENNTEPFIYLGEVEETLSYRGNKPIEFRYKLEHPIPEQLFVELTEKV